MCDLYEPSKGISLLKSKCPQCQSGKMFTHPFYDLKNFTHMEETCPVCKLKFEIEPGFFWGAMYVSYAFSVALMLIIGGSILLFTHGEADFWTYIIPIISSFILFAPLSYRYSRVIMIYLFSPIRFNPELAKKDGATK
jgi:uncharacterized protein (DUF983 family)